MKKLLCMGLACLLVLATGCQATPKMVNRNGIDKAVDKGEEMANQYLESSSPADTSVPDTDNSKADTSHGEEPTDPVTSVAPPSSEETEIQKIISSTPDTYKKTLSGGNGAVFDAKVIVPENVTTLGRYSAKSRSVDDADIEVLKNLLLGDRPVSGTNGQYECIMDDGMPASLRVAGPGSSSYGTFGFSWSSVYDNYPLLPAQGSNYARGCSFSLDEAVAKAQNLLDAIDITDFRLVSAKIMEPDETYGKREKTGSYEILYYQYVDNMPILADGTLMLNDRMATSFQAHINERGFFSTSLRSLNLTKTENITRILSLEQAVSLIESKLPSLWLSAYVPIMEISLEYMVNQTADGQLYVAPCWHFCVDKLEYYNLDIEMQRKHDSNDLIMDAVTGEMFRIADRYIFA